MDDVLPSQPPGCYRQAPYGLAPGDLPPPYDPPPPRWVERGLCPSCRGTRVTGPLSPGWPGQSGQPCPDCYGSGTWPPDTGTGHLVFDHQTGEITGRCGCDLGRAHTAEPLETEPGLEFCAQVRAMMDGYDGLMRRLARG